MSGDMCSDTAEDCGCTGVASDNDGDADDYMTATGDSDCYVSG